MGRKAMFYFVCFLLVLATGCSRRNPEAGKRAAVDEFFAIVLEFLWGAADSAGWANPIESGAGF